MSGANKTVVVLLIDYYSPGYKAGGPITTIKNMLLHLGDEFEFRIITRCYDLGEKVDYSEVEQDRWLDIDGGKIYYLGRSSVSFKGIRRVLCSVDYDVLYLNSFFSIPFSLFPVVLGKFGLIAAKRTILAPRGELSLGALGLNARRKRIYLLASKIWSLYKNVNWQASSMYEKADIYSQFPQGSIVVSPDLPPIIIATEERLSRKASSKIKNELKLLFLSRVSKMKGLYEAIAALKEQSAKINFDIFGPIEDQGYWDDCQFLINTLPDNVRVNYKGSVKPHEVSDLMKQYHLFILPTKGENFGHVIIESLSSGCPVLISDQTQWKGLETIRAGLDVPLSELPKFSYAINFFAEMTGHEWLNWSKGAQYFVSNKVDIDSIVEQNRFLFNAED